MQHSIVCVAAVLGSVVGDAENPVSTIGVTSTIGTWSPSDPNNNGGDGLFDDPLVLYGLCLSL